jgi:hypothetical protein
MLLLVALLPGRVNASQATSVYAAANHAAAG